ncbi:hypothetical protein [Actinomadura sp. 6N118]|uniref:hypothetical protein n=1 Tax=Actinomadura sp. 6N118 TaxID=3375151 RepID=UPI0037A04587
MRTVIRSEVRKLRATATTWWLLAGAVLLGIAGTVAALAFAQTAGRALNSDTAVSGALHSSGAGAMLVIVAGIIATAGEFRHGQAEQTFLSDPRRTPTLAAKTLVMAAVGAGFGLAAAAASLATTYSWLAARDVPLPTGSAVWLTVLGAVISAVLYAVLGTAIGAITRNQVTAIVVTVAWLTVAETVIRTATVTVGKWLPGVAALALRRDPSEGLLTMTAGGLVLAAWVLATTTAGLVRTRNADITG